MLFVWKRNRIKLRSLNGLKELVYQAQEAVVKGE